MNHDEYRSIQLMPNSNQFAQPEYLWFLRWHHGNWSAFVRAQWLTQPYDNKTGAEGTPYNAPTQNAVDMYDVRELTATTIRSLIRVPVMMR